MADVLDRLKAALADHYAMERKLRSGGMAAVYLAEDLKHRRLPGDLPADSPGVHLR